MAELIWTEPALHDLEAIADYIALDDPPAAVRHLVQRVFQHAEQLLEQPESRFSPAGDAAVALPPDFRITVSRAPSLRRQASVRALRHVW